VPAVLLSAGALVAVCALGAFLFASFTRDDMPEDGVLVRFSADGASEWYEIRGGSLMPLQYPVASGDASSVSVIESAAAPDGGVYVIGRSIPSEASVFGIIGRDGSFSLLRGGETLKSGLVSGPGGTAVFSETLPPPREPPAEDSFASDEDDTEEAETPPEGTLLTYRRGVDPAPASEPVATPAKRTLMLYDPASETAFLPIGEGREPRFLQDGSLIALAPEGVVRIPRTGARIVLLPLSATGAPGSALSPDGRLLAVNDSGRVGFYALQSSDEAATFSFIGIAPSVGELRDGSFTDEGQYVALSAENAALYRLPTPPGPASLIMRLAVPGK
jgi:hypothetical protein